jgi:cytochrome c peroxidase
MLFFDSTLSASKTMSCASCHSPSRAYGPPPALAVPVLRAVPSLRYTLARTPIWSHPRPSKRIEQLTEKDPGPAGGFAWDGRFKSLHEQAAFPLLAPGEMASTKEAVVRAVQHSTYAGAFRRAFGPDIFTPTDSAFAAIRLAIERFELEDPSFHPYSSKYDRYLDGKVSLTPQERHGLALFNDSTRGKCATCHPSARGADGSHPLFTDFEFEALGVPRNSDIPANHAPRFYDLGLCGPLRTDQPLRAYCGMFKTPTLRNVATRTVFFHNGRSRSLRDALKFYATLDGTPDLPDSLRANVNRTIRTRWTDAEIDDVMAFLETLTDE